MNQITPARSAPASPIKLHRHPVSGHCHRVELFLSILGLPYQLMDIDFAAQTHKSPEFKKMNPFGQIPVIEDGAVILADSNAILVYLALSYAPLSWLPRDPAGAAAVQRWLSIAAGPVAYGPAAARVINLFNLPTDPKDAMQRAEQLFTVMEQELAKQPYLTGATPTIADIANYAYIALAPEGGISIEPYPNLRAWLKRIEGLPNFILMHVSPVGLNA